MIYYVGNIVFMVALYLLIQSNPKIQNPHRSFCILASLQWILFVGVRNYEVVSDNYTYYRVYTGLQTKFWESILPDTLTLKGEWGYYLFAKFAQTLGLDFRAFIFLLAILFVGSFGYFVYRYSEDAFVSFLMFASFMIWTAVSPIKQMLAVIPVGIVSYSLLRKNNQLGYLAYIALGMLFHESAIVAFVLLFLPQWKQLLKHPEWIFIIVLVEYGLVVGAPGSVRSVLGAVLGEYGTYVNKVHIGSNTVLFSAMYFALFALCLQRRNSYDEAAMDGLAALMIICFILPFALLNSNFIRLTYYFMPLVALMMPAYYRSFDRSWGGLFRLASYILFILAGVMFTAVRAGLGAYVPFFLQ